MQFRKKPIVIEAEQFWPDKAPLPFSPDPVVAFDGTGFFVETIHDQKVYLEPGDWVIREPRGLNRAYPCKPDIFAETYEDAMTTHTWTSSEIREAAAALSATFDTAAGCAAVLATMVRDDYEKSIAELEARNAELNRKHDIWRIEALRLRQFVMEQSTPNLVAESARDNVA